MRVLETFWIIYIKWGGSIFSDYLFDRTAPKCCFWKFCTVYILYVYAHQDNQSEFNLMSRLLIFLNTLTKENFTR